MANTSSPLHRVVKHAAARAVARGALMFHHCTMLTAPAPPKRLFPIVFSDLDGTLLDHETYLFDAAQPALNALKARDIPLILASSKTRAEMNALHRKWGLQG
jgi:phosphoglycolate phosphatase-like HAD superfamily hydrolase